MTGAAKLGLAVGEAVTKAGSGLNGKRRKLHRILAGPEATVIMAEHREQGWPEGLRRIVRRVSPPGRQTRKLPGSGKKTGRPQHHRAHTRPFHTPLTHRDGGRDAGAEAGRGTGMPVTRCPLRSVG